MRFLALTDVFSFDGAIFAQISQNLAKNFQYKTNYDSNFGTIMMVDYLIN